MLTNHHRRGTLSRADLDGALPHPNNPYNPRNLLYALLPGLATQPHRVPACEFDSLRDKAISCTVDERSALLLSIIRGDCISQFSEKEMVAARARDILLRIIRDMSRTDRNDACAQSARHYYRSPPERDASAPINPFPSAILPSSRSTALAHGGMTLTTLVSSRHIHRVAKGAAVPSLPVVSHQGKTTLPPETTVKLASDKLKQNMPLIHDDETFSDATSSTTARDNGSISLETISSSETTSRPSRSTAFAVPLFMQSPDPLNVPIPIFASAAI